ncbi:MULTISPECIES: hypothetical protein [Streptomyces]|uniref:Uncharacterized protein n=1 Tax=Streptomyces solicathayae TaxID=3081768 RepID=A0ABZ0LYS4_9ACTN|nr:hypothetical protein [Streptomyces sp. HUAS YS2]WOX24671.1 hypothetical protein R2D22_26130 [Streptomyces sp. HUAS YS2]
MQETSKDTTETAAGRHRGAPAPQEEPTGAPHGRHRRDGEE